jgi:type II secretory pathway component GspD/PulD (secretin)
MWVNVVVGLLAGTAVQPPALLAAPDFLSGAAEQPPATGRATATSGGPGSAPVSGRSRGHVALNNAIESQRRGDFEAASGYFQEAQLRQADLTPAEREELTRLRRENDLALQARREAGTALRQAELALQQGRTAEAGELLKKAAANHQYLPDVDRKRAFELDRQLRLRASPAPLNVPPAGTNVGSSRSVATPQPTAPASMPAATTGDARAAAHAALTQARTQLSQANFDAAEALAHEAERAHVTFDAREDSPQRLLDDLARARKEPRALLIAARAALQRKDFDHAEQYAHLAEQNSSALTFNPFGDTPAKVLKDTANARSQAGAPRTTPERGTGSTAQVARKEPATVMDSMKGLFGGKSDQPSTTQTASATPQQPAPRGPAAGGEGKGAPASPETEKARDLVRQGRKSLADGDVVAARRYAEQARGIRADLQWYDDNPARLLDDITRHEMQHTGPSGVPARLGKDDAVAMLRKGRELLTEGNTEEAGKVGHRLKAVFGLHWSLFEDTPDALLRDVDKARVKNNKDEAARLLAEGRRLYANQDFEGAKKAAYRASSLHGPYTIWDVGDQPSKLLADVQKASEKMNRSPLPPPPHTPANDDPTRAVTQGGPRQPAAGPTGPAGPPPVSPEAAQAQKLLQDARVALQAGDRARARFLAEQARAMPVPFNRPGEDSPDAVCRDIARLGQATPPGQPPHSVASAPRPEQGPATTAPAGDSREAVHARARELLADARRLQAENRLLEARQKVVEAQRLGATFRPDEEGPEQVNQQVALQAHRQIEALLQRAGETFRFGTEPPPVRLRKAEQDLRQARELAINFRQDAQPIDRLLQSLEAMRGGSTPPAGEREVAEQRSPGLTHLPPGKDEEKGSGQTATASTQGKVLLDKARLELRAGETGNARHLAVEASAPQYGVRDEALALLRSIDNEEVKQRGLKASRTFDAARSAYLRRDYSQAAALMALIDFRLLDRPRQERFREILMTPEMQPAAHSSVAQAPTGTAGGQETQEPRDHGLPRAPAGPSSLRAGPAPLSEGPSSLRAGPAPLSEGPGSLRAGPAPSSVEGPNAAHATASDDPGRALMQHTQGLREVAFQKLRQDANKVQSEARDRFAAGQGDEAIEMLQDFIAHLGEEQLDPGQLTQLKRPVQARLDQFRLLKAQMEFRGQVAQASHNAQEKIKQRVTAEEMKHKNVSELMKQFNDLYRSGKYADAEALALRAHELDPDNGVATAAIHMARLQRRRNEYNTIKDGKENTFLNGANDAEDEGDGRAVRDILTIDPKRAEVSRARMGKLDAAIGPRHSEKEREIERRLSTPVNLNFKDTPLRQVVADIRAFHAINIWIDEEALREDAGVSPDRPVTVQLEQVALKSALSLMLRPIHLTYVIRDDVLQITTEKSARGKLERRQLQVADLIIPVQDFGSVSNPQVTMPGTQNGNAPMPSVPSPAMTPYAMVGGQAVGTPTGAPAGGAPAGVPPAGSSASSNNSPFAAESSGGVNVSKSSRAPTNEDMLIKLITSSVEPRSWADQGGPGTIEYFPPTMSLIINQTPDIQDQVQDLLDALRRMIDQEVAIEVRFITIEEDFFERIGVNFNLNIVQPQNRKYQPQLTTGNFQLPGYVNNFQPGNFLSGLTPAGTLTSDLNIPINVQTYNQAIPPFGGYPGVPGFGGITMGLAFLSEIQVFLFMEAVQGDVRTNVMQAPKLTLFNGQTASITVGTQQNFVSGVQVLPQMGLFTYLPQIQPMPLTTSLTIQAVISADRRFVRLSLTPSMRNLDAPFIELFPVVTPIFPLFDGSATGQPVMFTQFIQQPRISFVTVQTTVAVPDGGTVLMGGLKRLSEGRNEFGPPVLSKLPWINRLFKNVGYGREAQSLLIMVTPRIIIQAEEEERQTGYVAPPRISP